MVVIQPGIAINSADPSKRTPPSAFRRLWSTLLRQSSPGVPIAGVLPAQGGYTPLDVIPSGSAMAYTVKAGYAVTLRAGEGGYIIGTPTDVTVLTDPAHGSLSRIDLLYIVQPDYEKAETGDPRIDVAIGTAASSPVDPALPAGALLLGRKVIGAGVTNAAAGAAVTDKPNMTGLNIGSVTASQISDPQNLDVGKVNGNRWKSATTAPSAPSVGDVWVDYS